MAEDLSDSTADDAARDPDPGWFGTCVDPERVLGAAGPTLVLAAVRDEAGAVVDFRVEGINRSAAAVIGRPGHELVGDGLSTVGRASADGSLMDACQRVLDLGESFSGMVEWFDGDETFVDVHIAAMGDGVVLTGWDATEVHLAEEVLQVVDAAVDAVISLDTAGRFAYWSRAAERLYGWTAAEAIGQTPSLIAPEELHEEQASLIADGLAGHRMVFESTRRRKDGSVVPVEITAAPVRDHAGRVVRTASVHRDITERVAARAELEASRAELAERERSYRLVVDNSRDAITLTVGGVLTWASPAFVELTGVEPEQMTGTQLMDAIHPDDQRVLEAARARLVAGLDEQGPHQVRIRHRDGTWHWVELRVAPLLDDDGGVVGAVTNWRLVDDQVAFIDALARSEANNRELAAQLQDALDSRVRIEQAKGMVAAQRGISPEAAFEVIRDHGRRHGRKLHDVAHEIIELGLHP